MLVFDIWYGSDGITDPIDQALDRSCHAHHETVSGLGISIRFQCLGIAYGRYQQGGFCLIVSDLQRRTTTQQPSSRNQMDLLPRCPCWIAPKTFREMPHLSIFCIGSALYTEADSDVHLKQRIGDSKVLFVDQSCKSLHLIHSHPLNHLHSRQRARCNTRLSPASVKAEEAICYQLEAEELLRLNKIVIADPVLRKWIGPLTKRVKQITWFCCSYVTFSRLRPDPTMGNNILRCMAFETNFTRYLIAQCSSLDW